MKKAITLALVSMFLSSAGLMNLVCAQGYAVDAKISNQDAGNGTYNYTITLNNENSSGQSIGMFWFAWVPDYYGYDLLASNPTVTQMPYGWYAYSVNNSYYYPDGYSIEFYNYYGSDLTPGNSFTFGFNSADSPDTLNQNSSYYSIPTMTSFVYNDYTMSDAGFEFVVTPAVAPPPPPALKGLVSAGNGSFRFSFTNAPGYTFTVLGTTNLFLAVTNWTVVGLVTDMPPGSGSYQFTDAGAGTNRLPWFYRVSWP